MKNRALWSLGAGALLCAAAPPVSFAPTKPALSAATEDFRLLWQAEGPRIAASLEAVAGLSFSQSPIEALVTEGSSMAAFDGRSIRLRASHCPDQRKAMLIHELGHRLAFALPRPAQMDDHRLLYLFLYDVWSDLYGPDFANRMVTIERRNSDLYDYDRAWAWALAMGRAERQARLQALRSGAGARPERSGSLRSRSAGHPGGAGDHPPALRGDAQRGTHSRMREQFPGVEILTRSDLPLD